MPKRHKRSKPWIASTYSTDSFEFANGAGVSAVNDGPQPGDAAMTDWLLSGIAILTGGRDYYQHPIIECQASVLDQNVMGDESVKAVVLHLMSIPEETAQTEGFLFILDGRQATDKSVRRLLGVLVQVHMTDVDKLFKVLVILSELRLQLHQSIADLQTQDGFQTPFCVCFDVSFLVQFADRSQVTTQFDGTLMFSCDTWVKAKSAVDSYIDNCRSFAQQLDGVINLWRRMPTESTLRRAKEMLSKVDDFIEHAQLITFRQANPSANWATLSWSPEYQIWMQHINELCEHLVELKLSAELPSFVDPSGSKPTVASSKLKEENTIDSALAFMNLAEEEYLGSAGSSGSRRRDSLPGELEALQITAKDLCDAARIAACNILQSAFTSPEAKRKAVDLQGRVEPFLVKVQEKKDQLIVVSRVNSLIDKAFHWSMKSRKMLTIQRADRSAQPQELERMKKHCKSIYKSPRRPTAEDTLTLQKLARSVKGKHPKAYSMAQEAIIASKEADAMLENHMEHLVALQRGEYEPVINSEPNGHDSDFGSFRSVGSDRQCPPVISRTVQDMEDVLSKSTANMPTESVPNRNSASAEPMSVHHGTKSVDEGQCGNTLGSRSQADRGDQLPDRPVVRATNQVSTEASPSNRIQSVLKSEVQASKNLKSSSSQEIHETQTIEVATDDNQPDYVSELSGSKHSVATQKTRKSSPSNPVPSVLPERRTVVRNDKFMMQELVDTEKKYVSDLQYLCEHYLTAYRNSSNVPFCMKGRENELFGNIESLLAFHRDALLPKLEAIRTSPWLIGVCLTDYADEFGQYSLYFRHTKRREEILEMTTSKEFFNTFRSQLGDMMSLQDHLVRPFQRLTRYRQLLEGLSRFMYSGSEWDEDAKYALGLALRQIKFQLRHGNDLHVLDLLQDFDGSIFEQGNLLLQDDFIVFDTQQQKHRRRVFLFEDMIMFTKAQTEGGSPVFKFKNGWKTNELGLTANIRGNPKTFLIWFRKQTAKTTITMQTESEETKMEWVQEINYILYQQAMKFRERYGQAVVYAGVRKQSILKSRPVSTISTMPTGSARLGNLTL